MLALDAALGVEQKALKAVKYFTSRVSSPPDKHKRQATYLDALGTLPNLAIVYGKYQRNPHRCSKCRATEFISSEKMTDVNIAVEMLGDAYEDLFDMALLISADSDLTAPIAKVHALFPNKRVVIAFPPNRSSKELMKLTHNHFHIGRAIFERSQLPDAITKSDGYVLRRPERWR
jgi:uncharacterized LabA/DUF88 family protein